MDYTQKIKAIFTQNKILHSKVLLYVVMAMLTIKIISIAIYLPFPQNFFFADITKIDLLNLLNQNRESLGLSPLTESEKLNQAAELKAQDMVKNGYFSHESPQGITPWFWFKQAGYAYKYAGENLAVGFTDSATVHNAWFNSPSHKANLLSENYTQVGTAVLGGFDGGAIVVVQEFGNPQTVAVVSNPKPVALIQPQKVQSSVAPEPAPVQESPNSNVIPKVLAGSTEYIEGPEKTGSDNFYLKVLNFIVYDNNTILKYFSVSLIALIIFCLVINIFLAFRVPSHQLVFKSMAFIAALVVVMFIEKDMIAYIIPYQVFI